MASFGFQLALFQSYAFRTFWLSYPLHSCRGSDHGAWSGRGFHPHPNNFTGARWGRGGGAIRTEKSKRRKVKKSKSEVGSARRRPFPMERWARSGGPFPCRSLCEWYTQQTLHDSASNGASGRHLRLLSRRELCIEMTVLQSRHGSQYPRSSERPQFSVQPVRIRRPNRHRLG